MPLENLIQRGDIGQRLCRNLEIRGQKSPVLQLDNTVVPIVVIDDYSAANIAENPIERALVATVNQGAVAGELAILAVTNPLGSGVIGIVEGFIATGVTATSVVIFGLVNPAGVPATPANLFWRDRRIGATVAPAMRAFSGTNAALQIVNEYLGGVCATATAMPFLLTPGVIIQPGETFGVQLTVANDPARLFIWCKEIDTTQ